LDGCDWTRVLEVIDEIVLKGLKSSKIQFESDKIFDEYYNLLFFLIRFGAQNKKIMLTTSRVVQLMKNVLMASEHQKCNEILAKCIEMCMSSSINETAIDEFYSSCYKNVKNSSASSNLQRFTLLVTKLLSKHVSNFEPNAKCFISYHQLVFAFFYVLKSVKNDEKIMKCCADVKRHEIFVLISNMIDLSLKLITNGIYDAKVQQLIVYYLTYGIQMINEFKCSTIDSEMLVFYRRAYNILYDMIPHSELISIHQKGIYEIFQLVYKLWNMLSVENRKKTHSIVVVADKLFNSIELTDKNAKLVAMINLYVYIDTKQAESVVESEPVAPKVLKRNLVKSIYLLRKSAIKANFSDAADFIVKTSTDLQKFKEKLIISEIQSLELYAVFRYENEKCEEAAKIFNQLMINLKDDMKCFASNCQSINDTILNNVNLEKFRELCERLENYSRKNADFEITLALGCYNYYLYCIEQKSHTHEKNSSNEKPAVTSIKDQLKLIGLLTKSLDYFTQMYQFLKDDNNNYAKIQSEKILFTILENKSIQFLLRNVEYKDLEAQTLLWNLLNENNHETWVLSSASYFLDNYAKLTDKCGNYIKFNKTLTVVKIEDIIVKSRNVVQSMTAKIKELSRRDISCMYLYLLKLWIYYMTHKQMSDGIKMWKQFDELWKLNNLSDHQGTHNTIVAQIYYGMAEVFINCYSRNACNLLHAASLNLLKIKSIDVGIHFAFQHTFKTIALKIINYSINRQNNLDLYGNLVLSLKSNAKRSGCTFKMLEYTLLSIMKNLQMEKLDAVKVS
jgi:hypothetical protein